MQNNRKDEHLQLAMKNFKKNSTDFEQIRFLHTSLPEIDLGHTNISTSFLGMKFTRPFYINAMTGGSEKSLEINRKLGEIANQSGILIATGSASSAIRNDALTPTFRAIRLANPNGKIFVNISAQATVQEAYKALNIAQADGLQIHLNAPQELFMQEGDKNFSNWKSNIKAIVNEIHLPIIVKEVGFGMSKETIASLIDMGVKAVDISGRGGTNFLKIENQRSLSSKAYLDNWGLSTVESLLESSSLQGEINILASGGIQNGLDVVKALALGAKSVGISAKLLYILQKKGVDGAVEWLMDLEKEVHLIFTMLGCRTIEELQTHATLLFDAPIITYAQQRQIDLNKYRH
ncbi:MAG: type 2 isopentenyl-diphosphate Delta-isomerase [Streptococcaceae bacterium]|nr:type 2 isopentenyl-diphosphate Delta-isomerase [Streptococcaceae bacterium]